MNGPSNFARIMQPQQGHSHWHVQQGGQEQVIVRLLTMTNKPYQKISATVLLIFQTQTLHYDVVTLLL
jgi:hypothetical protein